MAGQRHTRDEVEGFLDHEFRQVWAVDRETGEYHYLDVGTAAEYRETAKARWKCPIPGCDGQINTRGGSRRDHFYHLDDHDHAPESEAHLAAKAMLRMWADQRTPDVCRVTEEKTVKDSGQSLHRRPDVFITDGQRQVAIEVEYKNFQPEAWALKHEQLRTMGIACTWLIGHTKVSSKPHAELDTPYAEVRVSRLAQAIGRAQQHVLVVNPVTRQIGTLSGDPAFQTFVSSFDTTAWLWVHSLDDCELHPDRGIVTPGTCRIGRAVAARRREEAKAKRAAEQQALHANNRTAKIERAQREQAAAWEASALYRTCIERWGEIPRVLAWHLPNPGGVFANESYWHVVVYEALVHKKARPFDLRDVVGAVRAEGLRINPNGKQRYRSLMQFVEQLAKFGLVEIDRSQQFPRFRPTGCVRIPGAQTADAS